MDVKGLKIRDVISHVFDIQIDRFVFESEKINFYFKGQVKILQNVEISKGLYIQDVPISEAEYTRFMCPVCYIQADVVVGEKDVYIKEGYINGVIRPHIDRSENIPITSRNSIQRFHFYYENLDEKLLGISSQYIKKPLIVQFKEWDIAEYEKFKQEYIKNSQSRVPAEFEVNINRETNPENIICGSFFKGKVIKTQI